MDNVNLMAQKEKVFFAGCLKSLLLSDGKIEENEVTDLHELTEKLVFNSFDSYLEKFENRVKTVETFWEMAENITDDDVQDLIITSLHDLQLKDHIPGFHNGKLLEELESMWT